jgi:hypothetical protein
MAQHVEIDLETLGTVPGSVILSIGAVIFDPTKDPESCLGKEFYCVVSKADSLGHGLTINAATLKWWEKQSPEAQQVLSDSESLDVADDLEVALTLLADFIPRNALIWSNGANFDQPLLSVAYDKCKMETPWEFWNSRCHRTILGLHPTPKSLMPKNQLAHNALEDAKTQAKHVVAVAKALKIKLN